jgi:NAD(P)-dependent dehydrogenase (short-subunit alcohol dehydrogenase family)
MKVLVIGGRGVIGSAVVALLSTQHEVLVGGRHGAEVRVDMTDPASIEAMYQAHPDLDAVVVTAGHVPFKPLQQLSEDDWQSGLHDKLMGQVRLVQIGARHLQPGRYSCSLPACWSASISLAAVAPAWSMPVWRPLCARRHRSCGARRG